MLVWTRQGRAIGRRGAKREILPGVLESALGGAQTSNSSLQSASSLDSVQHALRRSAAMARYTTGPDSHHGNRDLFDDRLS